jgi:hypothetical protein
VSLVKNFLGAPGYGEEPRRLIKDPRKEAERNTSWVVCDISDLADLTRTVVPVSSNHFAFDFSELKSLVDVNKLVLMPQCFSRALYAEDMIGIFGASWTGKGKLVKLDASSASCSPLVAASLFGHADVVDVLVTHLCGIIDVNQAGQNGETALHAAAATGHVEVVQKLLGKMSPEALVLETVQGKIALVLAVGQGHQEVAEAIISKCGLPTSSGVSATLLSQLHC